MFVFSEGSVKTRRSPFFASMNFRTKDVKVSFLSSTHCRARGALHKLILVCLGKLFHIEKTWWGGFCWKWEMVSILKAHNEKTTDKKKRLDSFWWDVIMLHPLKPTCPLKNVGCKTILSSWNGPFFGGHLLIFQGLLHDEKLWCVMLKGWRMPLATTFCFCWMINLFPGKWPPCWIHKSWFRWMVKWWFSGYSKFRVGIFWGFQPAGLIFSGWVTWVTFAGP